MKKQTRIYYCLISSSLHITITNTNLPTYYVGKLITITIVRGLMHQNIKRPCTNASDLRFKILNHFIAKLIAITYFSYWCQFGVCLCQTAFNNRYFFFQSRSLFLQLSDSCQ